MLVLIVIVLMTILIVSFLARSGTERAAGSAYHAAASAEMLASTAVNLVQSQINEAVSTTGGRTGSVWCSQPGAIRVFDPTHAHQKIYRLYSAGALATTEPRDLAANDLSAAADWKNNPAIWIDLNEPVMPPGLKDSAGRPLGGAAPGALVYPILDTRDPSSDLSDPQKTKFLDSKTDEWDENWGFSIKTDDTANPVGATAAAPCMPVRWIYVLGDGSLSFPQGGRSGSSIATIPKATAGNPVVGRIAFWTDDETCKVNINTAAGSRSLRPYLGDGSGRSLPLPAPWDTPRFKLFEERVLFSENQPVNGEYQRYPGHPATTDLFNIWNALGMAGTDYPPGPVVYADPVGPQPAPEDTVSSFYGRLPRYTDDNSSAGGSRNTTAARLVSSSHPAPTSRRFYHSLGELLFNETRDVSGVARQQVESGKFFLTAHSRAPDQTLAGTPRVAIWPVNADKNLRTPYDQLLAFCATAGGDTSAKPFYFQRGDSTDPSSDWDNIPRNREVYRYLQKLTDAEVPGSGGTLAGKYGGSERDQILTEMLDYVRTTNLTDHSIGAAAMAFTKQNPGQVTPLSIGTTRGLGRIPTLSEIGLLLICTADGGSPLVYQPPVTVGSKLVSPVAGSANDPLYVSNLPVTQYLRDGGSHIVGIDGTAATTPFPANRTLADTYAARDPGNTARLNPGQKRLQAMILLETACPMQGYDPMPSANNFQVAASGLHGIAIAGQSPFPDRVMTGGTTLAAANQNGDGVVYGSTAHFGSIQSYGGLLGFRSLLTLYSTYTQLQAGTYHSYQYNKVYNAWSGFDPVGRAACPYRFVSNPFTVNVSADGHMTLSGGCTLQLQVPLTGGKPAATYQTFNVSFPDLANLPVPDLPKTGIGYQHTENSVTTTVTTNAADWWNFDNRIAWTVYPTKAPPASEAAFLPYLDGQTPQPYLGPGCVIRADNPLAGTWTYQSTSTAPVYVPSLGAPDGSSDVVRALVARDGDYRLTAALATVDASGKPEAAFAKGPGYDDGGKLADLFMDQGSSSGTAGADAGGKLVAGAIYAPWFRPKVPATLDHDKQLSWDWDSGLPWEADGAYSNKPDEGNTYVDFSADHYVMGQGSPYYNRPKQTGNSLDSYFTANRIVPSPVMFGSLPTGSTTGNTWRTLLFRPQANRPPYANPSGPPDHFWLDLFTMPVVEPYAISEPFSTAGRINMNYQIQPFTFITRDTGVRAVLASELIARVPLATAGIADDGACGYKGTPTVAAPPADVPHPQRLPLTLNETNGTLHQFEERFNRFDLFRSASEICDLYLVPRGYMLPAFKEQNQWYGDDFALAGDNVRERPYGDIYPRLTTRSNTFTVHYRVQVLRSPDATSTDAVKAAQWDERRGAVIGEARGSATIERYLDPTRTDLPDYAADPFQRPLDSYYEWRTIGTSRFPP